MFHNVMQAGGRGRCRHTVDGKAQPMTLSLICNDTFPASLWQAAMPGVVVSEWRAKHATKVSMQDDRVRAVEAALGKVRVDSVSFKSMRPLAGLEGIHPDVYTGVLAKVSAPGWHRKGRSFIRTGSPAEFSA